MGKETISERIRAHRASNDLLARRLGIDPQEQHVTDAEHEVLRLARLVPRAPQTRIVETLLEACHRLLDADTALAAKRAREKR